MRHFFIDLENVRSYGLEGVLLLKPEDMVYVFYSDNANTLTIPTIESLNESPATVKYIKTNYTGANAMDFQIVTLLGATIERDKTGAFYIISHDNGFKSAVKFCEGYFTAYDIVTGVFANIILAINSEKNGKSGQALAVSLDNKSGDNKASDQKRNRRNRHHKKNNMTAEGIENVNEALPENQESVEATVVEAENVKSDESSLNEEGTSNKKSRSRKRIKNRKNKDNKFQAEMEPEKIVMTSDSEDVIANDEAMENDSVEYSEDEAVNTKKNRYAKTRRNRRNNRKHQGAGNQSAEVKNDDIDSESKTTANSESKNQKISNNKVLETKDSSISDSLDTDNTAEKKNSSETQNTSSRKKSGDKKDLHHSENKKTGYKQTNYLYRVLSDYLSKSTIDMYASAIDEGVRVSNNKEDLHKFFKKKYESDEAEALFKIIGSDFNELKLQSKSN